MSNYSLAVVCLLGLLAGGAVALALHHARQGGAEVQGAVGKSADIRGEAGAETGAEESRAAEDSREEEGVARGAGGEAADDVENRVGVPAGNAKRRGAGMRVRVEAGGPAGDGPWAGRRYARASGRQVASGGRGVAGHALGGVKKTGEGVKKTGAVIGRTFGKVGGVFHE